MANLQVGAHSDIVRTMAAAPIRQVILACATGFLYPLCFPDFDLGQLAWVLLLPLHLALDGVTRRRAFWLGWLAGVIAFIGTMFWVVVAMHDYGHMPVGLSYALMVLLATYLGLYLALYAVALTWLRRSLPFFAFFGAPFIWVTLELIRTYLLSGLPWDLLGYSQYLWLPVIQIADHTGVYGVSFIIVLVNAALAEVVVWSLHRLRDHLGTSLPVERFSWLSPAAAMLIMTYTLAYGDVILKSGVPPDGNRSLTVGVVQANIDQARKWDAAY
ncbi:MAG: hypothetical protein ACE5NA_10740, partial [Nitrospiraceae bacterium]